MIPRSRAAGRIYVSGSRLSREFSILTFVGDRKEFTLLRKVLIFYDPRSVYMTLRFYCLALEQRCATAMVKMKFQVETSGYNERKVAGNRTFTNPPILPSNNDLLGELWGKSGRSDVPSTCSG
jgi:hypothetical protein